MRARNFISFAFAIAFGVAMAMLGYLGRANFTDGQSMILMTLFASMIGGGLFLAIWNFDVSRRQSHQTETGMSSIEKRKRDHIDSVLRDLSDEDLIVLKQRLSASDDEEGHIIDEEGELRVRSYRR